MSKFSWVQVVIFSTVFVSAGAQAVEPTAESCTLQKKIEADPNGLTPGNLKSVALFNESLSDSDATKSPYFIVAELGRPNGKLKIVNRATGEVKSFAMQGPDSSNKPFGATSLDLEGGDAKAHVLSSSLSARIGETLGFGVCGPKSRKTESSSASEAICLKNQKDVAEIEKMLAGQETMMVLLPSAGNASESFAIDLRKRLFPKPKAATVCTSLLMPVRTSVPSKNSTGGTPASEDAVQ